jgi:hypothetical protein
MQETDKNEKLPENDTTQPSTLSKEMQEKSDPQLTELRGFMDPDEDLEPTLQDGTKSPDK